MHHRLNPELEMIKREQMKDEWLFLLCKMYAVYEVSGFETIKT